MQIYLDGEFVAEEEAKLSVFDHGLLYGDGVFEGIRAYNGRVFELEGHIKRLYDSAKAIALDIPMSRTDMIEATLETVRRNGLEDGYIRLVVTRGVGDLGLNPVKCEKPTVFIIAATIRLYAEEMYRDGLKIITCSTRRNTPQAIDPAVKSLNYLNNILASVELRGTGAHEGLMLNTDGYVAECTADNFFIVRDGCIVTPAPGVGALRGITRAVVMNLVREEMGREVEEGLYTLYDVYTADEAFLTGTAAEVAPVVELDGRSIGSGRPGEMTLELMERFRAYAQRSGTRIYPDSCGEMHSRLSQRWMMSNGRHMALYDTTLRNGMQMEGMSVSVAEKIRIALRLADLGIDYIEGGFPGSNPKDAEFFRQMEKEPLGETRLAAFGTTRAAGVAAEKDKVLRTLADTNLPVLCIVGKTWDLHVEKVLRVDREENLRMIYDSVAFLRGRGHEVIYDAEHFFEGYTNHPEYAVACLLAAVEGGAGTVVLCDTNGANLPVQVREVVRNVVGEVGDLCVVGIHSHNDSACAVANSLSAVEVGALHVQGTINGYGERCGNADLCSIIPNLQVKMGFQCIPAENLAGITDLSHFVAEVCNLPPDPHQPYVGSNDFAHKGGLHVSAISEDPRTFEHIEPRVVGNIPHILVSELSGKGTVRRRLEELGYASNHQSESAGRILEVLKAREHQGYQYEAADASFELLLRDELGLEKHFFKLESFRIIVEK